ncbi:MAG: IPT/TIG domain-containing protein [Gemmatimonas sp.]
MACTLRSSRLPRFSALVLVAVASACSGASHDGAPTTPGATNGSGNPGTPGTPATEPPRAAFTMRSDTTVAANGSQLSLGTRRGETVSVTLDGSSSSAPGSIISKFEWRVNGTLAGSATSVIVALASAPSAYQIELEVTSAAGMKARATAAIVVVELQPAPAPHVDEVFPAPAAATRATQTITLLGQNFQTGVVVAMTKPDASVATFGGDQLESVTAGSIRLPINFDGLAGTYAFVVRNPDGQSSNSIPLAVLSVDPVITSLDPTSFIGASSPQTLIIKGRNFDPKATVILRNLSTGAVFDGSTIITRSSTAIAVSQVFPAAAATWSAEVVNPDGGRSGQVQFPVTVPASPSNEPPVITSVTPNPITASSSLQTLSIVGKNFRSGIGLTVVLRNQLASITDRHESFLTVSSTALTLSVGLTSAGNWTAQVIDPDGAVSSEFPFTVVAATSLAITSVGPAPIYVVRGGIDLTASGTGFVSPLAVEIARPGGVPQFYMNGRSVTATSFGFIGDFDRTGTWGVRVRLQDGRTSPTFYFSVIWPPPTISSVTPNPVYGISVPQAFWVKGKYFDSTATVTFLNLATGQRFSSMPISGRYRDPADYDYINVAATFSPTPAAWAVEVMNPDGRSASTQFEVLAPVPPTITSMFPASITASSTWQPITLVGEGFVVPKIMFYPPNDGAAIPAGAYFSADGKKLWFQAMLATPGAWKVQLTNPDGAQSSMWSFTVVAP